jgi:succinate dehydrogenase/fumarate reductase flavoprotein subunit
VIVVGGGGSGLAAAANAAECRAEVLLLVKQPHLGGTTGVAVGSFTAAATQLQRAVGIEDDVYQARISLTMRASRPAVRICSWPLVWKMSWLASRPNKCSSVAW